MALAHEFLLDHVLDVLDVDEGLVATADALGDGLGDVHGGLGVFLDGEECLADGDFDFRFRPRDDVAVAADQADGKGVGAGAEIDMAGALEGAAEGEGFRDVVGFVFEQGFFDEEVEIAFGKAEAAAFLKGLGEGNGDGVGDKGNELAVDLGEDGFLVLAAGDEEVGEGVSDGVGDVLEGEHGLLVAAGDDDVGVRGALFIGNGNAPVVLAF